MLDQSFHTPLPLDLEIGLPSGDIEIETVEGEESHVTVDGDERLLADVEIRQDGNRVVVAFRGKAKFGFSFTPFSLVWDSKLRVRASIPHGAAVTVKAVSANTQVAGRLGSLGISSVSGDARVRGEITGDVTLKTVSGDASLASVGGNVTLQSVSGDLRVGPVGGSIDTKTVSGDIRFDAVSSGDVRFTSISGDIEIGITEGSLLDVDAGSTSGDLTSEVPLSSEPVAGSGTGGTVVVRGRTTSGDVRVFRAA